MLYPRYPVSRRQQGFTGPFYAPPPVLPESPVVSHRYGVRLSDNPHSMANVLEIPFSAISLTKRETSDVGQITVASARNWMADITDRADNLVQVYRTNIRRDGSLDEDELALLLIDTINSYFGGRSSSISLSMRSDRVYTGAGSWAAEGVSYQAERSGRSVVRCRIIPKLSPLDTLTFGALSFIVSYATFVISLNGSIWVEAGE